MAFLPLMLRPCGWDGQKGMRQQSRAELDGAAYREVGSGGGLCYVVALFVLREYSGFGM